MPPISVSMELAEEAVSTVFVGGLPPDATDRELDNLCRFIPGFVNARVDHKKGKTLFARFDTPASAHKAIAALNGQVFDRLCLGEPMRAFLARSNMKSDGPPSRAPRNEALHSVVTYPPVSSYPAGNHSTHVGRPNSSATAVTAKRPRSQGDYAEVDTVASVGAAERGFDEATLHAFFMGLPGFVTFKANPRMGGGFAKFDSASQASKAIASAKQQGIPAEMAKSSMGSALTVAPERQPPPPEHHVPLKRHRTTENPSQVDTVACVGAAERGFDEGSLQNFFVDQPGFLHFKANPRMGGGFAKFETPALAAQAIRRAQDHGIPADIAKSSMSSNI